MKKLFRVLASLLLIFVVVGLGVVSLSLGRIVKAAVEAAGPRVLGVSVSVEGVTILPWSGRGSLRGLLIGNPRGFKGAHAVKVGSVEMTVKLSSLMTDLIVVERVVVQGPEILYELGPGGSNLARLQANAEAASALLGAGKAKVAPKAPAGKSLLIRDFAVSEGRVAMAASVLGGQDLSVALPAVHLTNLGGRGRSPADVAAQALKALTGAAAQAASGLGIKSLGSASEAAKKVLGSLGGIFKTRSK